MALRARIRTAFDADPPATFEDASQRMVTLLHGEFVDDNGAPGCALVRIFKTHRFDELSEGLTAHVRATLGRVAIKPDGRFLVLMGTTGAEQMWTARHYSRGHQAIPLLDASAVAQIPMVAQLIRELGLEIATVLRPDAELLLEASTRDNSVFHVLDAVGSPYIAAQRDFVIPYGVKSVLGFGGLLASGDLVAAILFSTTTIPASVAEQFKIIGLTFKLAMLPYVRKPSFAGSTV